MLPVYTHSTSKLEKVDHASMRVKELLRKLQNGEEIKPEDREDPPCYSYNNDEKTNAHDLEFCCSYGDIDQKDNVNIKVSQNQEFVYHDQSFGNLTIPTVPIGHPSVVCNPPPKVQKS